MHAHENVHQTRELTYVTFEHTFTSLKVRNWKVHMQGAYYKGEGEASRREPSDSAVTAGPGRVHVPLLPSSLFSWSSWSLSLSENKTSRQPPCVLCHSPKHPRLAPSRAKCNFEFKIRDLSLFQELVAAEW